MQNLLNPKWIVIINTLPIVVLLFIFFGEFSIIESLLKEENISLWKSFAWVLIVLALLNFIYALYLIIKKKKVSFYYAIIALLCYIPFIYLYGHYASDIIPFTIPRWMLSGDLTLYVGTFLMPTLAYALFVLVITFTSSKEKEYKAWKNFLIAIGIPIVWYLFLQIIVPLWQPVYSEYYAHTLLICLITGTLLFLFFLIRGIFILATKKSAALKKYQYFWKVPIAIIFPILGLLVNSGFLFNTFGSSNSGIFGDFNNIWFYILAIVNGVLICLPNLEKRNYRLLLTIGRSITFAYTFYFFIVFLPFLPLSIIAIIAIGTGFLMLAPLVLFVIHITELSRDINFLTNHFSKKVIWGIVVVSILVIPFVITFNYTQDRKTLHQTLDYVYNPNYSESYDIDLKSLRKTLNVVQSHKERSNDFVFGQQQPYLSSYFRWLVLDNLTLSNTKINTLERIFFDEEKVGFRSENIRNKNVNITDISSSSSFDSSQNVWKSWIDVEITNASQISLREYATTITLPEGTWISDYYLYVGDKKEMGILAEKKSAMWVFSNIRNENRDPGILYYLTGNNVAFRVFPFAKNEVRKTGIELLHKEPIQLSIDGHSLQLGNNQSSQQASFENEDIAYVSSQEKEQLKKVQRTPYFHFITDISTDKGSAVLINQIEDITKKHPSLSTNAKISYTNHYVHTEPLSQDWKQRLETQDYKGGFYVDRAIKSVLYDSYLDKKDTYPVIVVITDTIQKAVFDKDFSDWKFTFPESDVFYTVKDKELIPHSLVSNPERPIEDDIPLIFNHSTLEHTNKDNTITYLRNDSLPSVILKKDLFKIPFKEIKNKEWLSALMLESSWRSQTLHPEISEEEWLTLVKSSFASRIMTPVTSYLVVENEAQKAILLKKQQQVLSGKKSLDLGEDTERMSEPSIFIVAILLGGILWYRKKRQAKLMGYKKK